MASGEKTIGRLEFAHRTTQARRKRRCYDLAMRTFDWLCFRVHVAAIQWVISEIRLYVCAIALVELLVELVKTPQPRSEKREAKSQAGSRMKPRHFDGLTAIERAIRK